LARYCIGQHNSEDLLIGQQMVQVSLMAHQVLRQCKLNRIPDNYHQTIFCNLARYCIGQHNSEDLLIGQQMLQRLPLVPF